jgi:hypothetical protein
MAVKQALRFRQRDALVERAAGWFNNGTTNIVSQHAFHQSFWAHAG